MALKYRISGSTHSIALSADSEYLWEKEVNIIAPTGAQKAYFEKSTYPVSTGTVPAVGSRLYVQDDSIIYRGITSMNRLRGLFLGSEKTVFEITNMANKTSPDGYVRATFKQFYIDRRSRWSDYNGNFVWSASFTVPAMSSLTAKTTLSWVSHDGGAGETTTLDPEITVTAEDNPETLVISGIVSGKTLARIYPVGIILTADLWVKGSMRSPNRWTIFYLEP